MAAECPNGSVPWKQIYGEDEFILKPPLFESQIRAAKQARRVDAAQLERAAKDYSARRLAALEEAERRQREVAAATGIGVGAVVAAAPVPSAAAVVAAAPVAAAGTAAAPAAADGPPLPPGWAVATAPSGKKYYYHTQTQKRVWKRPTAETPIS
jgi:hypothetical protein